MRFWKNPMRIANPLSLALEAYPVSSDSEVILVICSPTARSISHDETFHDDNWASASSAPHLG